MHNPKTLLNAKSELVYKCFHMTKYELKSLLPKPKKNGPKDANNNDDTNYNDEQPPWRGDCFGCFFGEKIELQPNV